MQHLTDVQTRRIVTRAGDGYAAISWDYPGSTLLEVRIFRSLERHGDTAHDYEKEGSGQTLVYYDVTGSYRDQGLDNGTTYYYTMWARHPGQQWVHWGNYELTPGAESRSVSGELPQADSLRAGFWKVVRRVLPAVAALLCAAALAGAAPAAYAAGESAAQVGSDDATQGAAGAAQQEPDAVRGGGDDFVAAALADPAVSEALGDVSYISLVTEWGGVGGTAAGATVVFTWPAAEARDAGGVWPLLVGSGPPAPPYEAADFRIRTAGLTGLAVDVLADGGRVIQIMPRDAATEFELREQTWPPSSWFPWFTAYPWVLLPVFVAVGVVIIARAWRRSRAWNRRLPSMTRHDRQFIGRLAVILFLIAGMGWMVYQSAYAVGAPSADPATFSPGDLTTLPLLLFAPALLLAALVLEITPAPHRAAWGLVALLAGAGSIYNLAAATWGTATNLVITYYVLLAVVCLIAAPRAFSAGRMGWSRSYQPRYG
jgi:hypothetical protein